MNTLKILILSRSLLANAPIHLCNFLNKYGENKIEARCITTANGKIKMSQDICWIWDKKGHNKILQENINQFKNLIDWCDLIEIENQPPFQNGSEGWEILSKTDKPIVVRIHSEPNKCVRMYRDMQKHFKISKTLVIAQYQSVFMPKAMPDVEFTSVRNVLDINLPYLKPRERNNRIPFVTFAPSNKATLEKLQSKRGSVWAYKSFYEVSPILQKLAREGLITYKILHEMDYIKSLKIRQKSDIFIGDIHTGSYHLAELEGLSQGCLVISNIADWMSSFLRSFLGDDFCPFLGVDSKTLESTLRCWIKNFDFVRKMQGISRDWVEFNWSPFKVFADYYRVYSEVLIND